MSEYMPLIQPEDSGRSDLERLRSFERDLNEVANILRKKLEETYETEEIAYAESDRMVELASELVESYLNTPMCEIEVSGDGVIALRDRIEVKNLGNRMRAGIDLSENGIDANNEFKSAVGYLDTQMKRSIISSYEPGKYRTSLQLRFIDSRSSGSVPLGNFVCMDVKQLFYVDMSKKNEFRIPALDQMESSTSAQNMFAQMTDWYDNESRAATQEALDSVCDELQKSRFDNWVDFERLEDLRNLVYADESENGVLLADECFRNRSVVAFVGQDEDQHTYRGKVAGIISRQDEDDGLQKAIMVIQNNDDFDQIALDEIMELKF